MSSRSFSILLLALRADLELGRDPKSRVEGKKERSKRVQLELRSCSSLVFQPLEDNRAHVSRLSPYQTHPATVLIAYPPSYPRLPRFCVQWRSAACPPLPQPIRAPEPKLLVRSGRIQHRIQCSSGKSSALWILRETSKSDELTS